MSWSHLHKSVDTAYGAVRVVLLDVERLEVAEAIRDMGPSLRRSIATWILHRRLLKLEEAERRLARGETPAEIEAAERLEAELDPEP